MVMRLAMAASWAGGVYGILMVAWQATLGVSSGATTLDNAVRIAVVGGSLYGAALYLTVIRNQIAATVLMFVIVPLNVMSLGSIGIFLVPATVLFTVSTMLLWISVGRSLAAIVLAVLLLLVVPALVIECLPVLLSR